MLVSNRGIKISDALDSEGELEIEILNCGDDCAEEYAWIDKEEAIELVKHLQRLFGI